MLNHELHHIKEMIAMISNLVEKNHAYIANGHVLFQVSTMNNYGLLSLRSKDDMIAVLVLKWRHTKKHLKILFYWKPSEAHQPGWASPWGRGRPDGILNVRQWQKRILAKFLIYTREG